MQQKHKLIFTGLCAILCINCLIATTGCTQEEATAKSIIEKEEAVVETTAAPETIQTPLPLQTPEVATEEVTVSDQLIATAPTNTEITIPAYDGSPYVEINNNVPLFTDSELTTTSFESYNAYGSLDRAGVACANIGIDLMPTEERGSIGMVKPSGWHTVRYDGIVDGNYLYNRCHLIGYQLTGERDTYYNLITGTRYLNIEGMLPFENQVADYIKSTNHHVLYRVTPVYEGDNLVASGVFMEAKSVEDHGEGIQFYVYCYNVQPGIDIDYATGDSALIEQTEQPAPEAAAIPDTTAEETITEEQHTYVINTNTGKFHETWCSSVEQMAEHNKWVYTGTRDAVIAMHYDPCQRCNP